MSKNTDDNKKHLETFHENWFDAFPDTSHDGVEIIMSAKLIEFPAKASWEIFG